MRAIPGINAQSIGIVIFRDRIVGYFQAFLGQYICLSKLARAYLAENSSYFSRHSLTVDG